VGGSAQRLAGSHRPRRGRFALDRTQRRSSCFVDLGVQVGRVVAPDGVVVGDRPAGCDDPMEAAAVAAAHWSISWPRRARAMKVKYSDARSDTGARWQATIGAWSRSASPTLA
jgi:hypothetical protein